MVEYLFVFSRDSVVEYNMVLVMKGLECLLGQDLSVNVETMVAVLTYGDAEARLETEKEKRVYIKKERGSGMTARPVLPNKRTAARSARNCPSGNSRAAIDDPCQEERVALTLCSVRPRIWPVISILLSSMGQYHTAERVSRQGKRGLNNCDHPIRASTAARRYLDERHNHLYHGVEICANDRGTRVAGVGIHKPLPPNESMIFCI